MNSNPPFNGGFFMTSVFGTNAHTGRLVIHQQPTNGVIMSTILLVILILLVIGAMPNWPYSKSWGYYPSGGLGLVLVILLILVLMGRI